MSSCAISCSLSDRKDDRVTEINMTNRSLILPDGQEFMIPVRGDGYVNVTKLCKAAGKRIDNWMRLKESQTLLESCKGNSSNFDQGTFAHPDIAIQIAQWCSPSFGEQIRKFIEDQRIDEVRKEEREKYENALIVSQNKKTEEIVQDQSSSSCDTAIRQTEFILTLQGKEYIIKIRPKDGFINLTQLAKALGYRIDNYFQSERTQAFLKASEKVPEFQVPEFQVGPLVDRSKGKNTYVHRLVVYNYLQYANPSFALYVSQVLDNLFLIGKVELGKEKSSEELDSIWKEKYEKLQAELSNLKIEISEISSQKEELEETLENTKEEVKDAKLKLKEEEKEKLRIKKNHDAILKKREYHKMKKGDCLYVWHSLAVPTRFKIGVAEDINSRLKSERTCVPDLYLDAIFYTSMNKFMETAILERYRDKLVQPNREFIETSKTKIIASCKSILRWIKNEYTEEDEIWKYNDEEEPVQEEVEPPVQSDIPPSIVINNYDMKTVENNNYDMKTIYDLKTINYTYNIQSIPVGNKLLTLDNIKEFILKHEDGFKCPVEQCEKTFKRSDTVKDHIKEQHFQQHVACPHCDKTFARKTTLTEHIKKEHVDGDKPKFSCDQCNKEYKSKSSLTEHITTVHAKTQDISCPHCNTKFSKKYGLTRHLNSTCKQKPLL